MDDELMRRIALGDQDAFTLLHTRWNRRLGNWLWLNYRCRNVADVSQEVWIKVFRGAASYKPRRHFAAWLYEIARNMLVDMMRRDKSSCETTGVSEQLVERYLSATGDSESRAIVREETSRVLEVLSELPESQQQVFSLYVFTGLTLPEIAERTGQPVATTKSRLRLAKSRIRTTLGVVVNGVSVDDSEHHREYNRSTGLSVARHRGVQPCGTEA